MSLQHIGMSLVLGALMSTLVYFVGGFPNFDESNLAVLWLLGGTIAFGFTLQVTGGLLERRWNS